MILDLAQPVEPLHPLVQGRVGWWYGVSGSGGRLSNIMPGDRFHGSLMGGTGWGPTGRGDSGASFTANNQWIETPSTGIFNSLKSFTVAVTCLTNTTSASSGGGGLRYIAATEVAVSGAGVSGWLLRYNPSQSRFEFFVCSGGSYIGPATWSGVSAGVVYDLVATYNGSRLRLFVNGSGGTDFSTTASVNAVTRPLYIGSAETDTLRQWSGSISSVSFSSRAWTDAEADARREQELRGYRTPDSPLRFIRGTIFGLPLGGGGGGSVRIPRFILQTRRRLTGVS